MRTNAPAFTIRPATVDDAETLAHVRTTGWQTAYRGIIPDSYLDRMDAAENARTQRAALANPAPGTHCLAAITPEGEVLGFVIFGPRRDDDLPPAAGEVYFLYVLPEGWGSGAGLLLFERAMRDLRQAGYAPLVLWTLEGNRRARRFYERCGWQTDGARKLLDFDGALVAEVRYRDG